MRCTYRDFSTSEHSIQFTSIFNLEQQNENLKKWSKQTWLAKNARLASQSIVVGLSRKVLSFPLCAPSLLLLIAPLYGLININCQYLALISCKKSHFEICHLKYFTSFYFGHLNFWSGIDYCTVKYNPSPKGCTYTYLDHPEVFDWWAFS